MMRSIIVVRGRIAGLTAAGTLRQEGFDVRKPLPHSKGPGPENMTSTLASKLRFRTGAEVARSLSADGGTATLTTGEVLMADTPCMVKDRHQQTWHDKAARTYVIER